MGKMDRLGLGEMETGPSQHKGEMDMGPSQHKGEMVRWSITITFFIFCVSSLLLFLTDDGKIKQRDQAQREV